MTSMQMKTSVYCSGSRQQSRRMFWQATQMSPTCSFYGHLDSD